jgi:hypothetical protein
MAASCEAKCSLKVIQEADYGRLDLKTGLRDIPPGFISTPGKARLILSCSNCHLRKIQRTINGDSFQCFSNAHDEQERILSRLCNKWQSTNNQGNISESWLPKIKRT